MDIIDPHLHLFNLDNGQYDWLKPQHLPSWPDKNKINQNFAEHDLRLSPEHTLAGFVHIEAGFDNAQPWRELDWLEQHCTLPFKSVAGGDLCAKNFPAVLSKLQTHSSLVGVRHILDDDAQGLLTTKRFQQHLALLAKHGLSFDAQFSLQDISATQALCKVLENTPELRIIINHGGWPPTSNTSAAWQVWQQNLTLLAQYPQVAIKLSGWEMQNRTYSRNDIQRVLVTCLETMAQSRVMLASNFPLNTFSCSYAELWRTYTAQLGLSDSTSELLVHKNSAFWYQF